MRSDLIPRQFSDRIASLIVFDVVDYGLDGLADQSAVLDTLGQDRRALAGDDLFVFAPLSHFHEVRIARERRRSRPLREFRHGYVYLCKRKISGVLRHYPSMQHHLALSGLHV